MLSESQYEQVLSMYLAKYLAEQAEQVVDKLFTSICTAYASIF
jgi:hypothetical protein